MTFTTRKTSYAPITISAAELAQANASARKLYDAISAEQDAWLAARMARDAEEFYRFHCGPIVAPAPVNPLDVKYDGLMLRILLARDELRRQETFVGTEYERDEALITPFTSAQHSAITTHWSAELRAKIDAAKQKEREVVSDYDEDRP